MFSGVSEKVEDDLKHEEEEPSETEKWRNMFLFFVFFLIFSVSD